MSAARSLMPVLRPPEDGEDVWWSIPRREPFDRADVLSRVPWPSEPEGLAAVKAMVDQRMRERHVRTVTVERLHILHEGHPSDAVRLAASGALLELGVSDYEGYYS